MRFLPWNPSAARDALEVKAHFPIDVTDPNRTWVEVDRVNRPSLPWQFLELVDEPDDTNAVINQIAHIRIPARWNPLHSHKYALVKEVFLGKAEKEFCLIHFDSLTSLKGRFPWIDTGKAQERFTPGWYNLLSIDADADYIDACPAIPFQDTAARLESQDVVFEWAREFQKYSATIIAVTLSKNEEELLTLIIEHNDVDTFQVILGEPGDRHVVIRANYVNGCKTLVATTTKLKFPSTVRRLQIFEVSPPPNDV